MKKRKLPILAGTAVVVLVAGTWGYTSLKGASTNVDPSKLVAVERGTMVRSVVATGKVEPVTKIEVKSKANGIIEKLNVEVDQVVPAGAVLAELDKEQLRARVRELEANLLAKGAALAGAEAQLKKTPTEAEGPDATSARRNFERAK